MTNHDKDISVGQTNEKVSPLTPASDPAEAVAQRPSVTPVAVPATPAPNRPKRRRLLVAVVVVAVLGTLGWTFGYPYWIDGRFMVQTDDAYVQAEISAISPRIQGYLDTVAVEENQMVAAGDPIASLDDGDYRIALATATSRIETQKATLATIQAQTAAAEAGVGLAEAQLRAAEAVVRNAGITTTRLQSLVSTRSTPQAKLDDAEAALEEARASVAGAKAQIASAEANVAVLRAQYAEAESQMKALTLAVDQARRNLDLTVLRAPFAGVVANIAVEKGDLVSPGQRIAAVVPVEALYVEANFKETQLGGIRPGATVTVTLDALPGQTFRGAVASIAPATGALFSILPATNATGNFTKIVQRVPVRISLPPEVLATGVLRAGLSAIVEVDSRTPAH